MHNIFVIAHRGNGPTSHLSGNGKTVPATVLPENTVSAFREAVHQGADGIEFDLRLTRDRIPVIIHDDALNLHVEGANRAAFDYGKVSANAFSAVRRLNVGQGQHIPTLNEAFDFFTEANTKRARQRKPPLMINIDLKDKSGDILPVAAGTLTAYCARGGIPQESLVFSSSDYAQLSDFKRAFPAAHITPVLKTAHLFGAENVKMPGWHVHPDTPYRAGAFNRIAAFAKTTPCLGVDAVLADIYAPLVGFAQQQGMSVFASACNVRRYDNEHLLTVLAISRLAPVYLRTDEPGIARESIARKKRALEAVFNGLHVIVKAEAVASPPLIQPQTFVETRLQRRIAKPALGGANPSSPS